jgi:hypothetical protein
MPSEQLRPGTRYKFRRTRYGAAVGEVGGSGEAIAPPRPSEQEQPS